MRRPLVLLGPLALALAATVAAQDKPADDALSAERRAALDHISADSLRGHLSFLASDLLEGRQTPSLGQDLAAEYIAAQFRRAGLEPAGDDGYFQVAKWKVSEPDESSFALEFRIAGDIYRVHPGSVSLSAPGKLDLAAMPLVKIRDAADLATKGLDALAGRAVLIDSGEDGVDAVARRRALLAQVRTGRAALIVSLDRTSERGSGLGAKRLVDPEGGRAGGFRLGPGGPPSATVHDPKVTAALDALKGPVEATVTLRLGEPVTRDVKLRNVAGLLRGSDPQLRDTYVLVTAHYDHLGMGAPIKGDAIFNGANDDGSGTVSVIEVASALATLKERPKRSILFLTFWGEEHGLLGSRYYGKHPLVPIARTVADVNLEQVGRTDDSEGPKVATATITGMDYSDVGRIFAAAGEAEGVKVYRHPRNSDPFFARSDNQALADLGVPAHTLAVAFMFPDYHGLADHWDKIDYANMAKIDRLVARGLLRIADDPEPPKWSADNAKARKYLKAYEALHPKAADDAKAGGER